jgi:type 1 glutamine amidotransferase
MAGAAMGDPMRALIVDGQSNHNWKQTTPVLRRLLEETGLFAVDVATSPAKGQDMSGFMPNFAAYKVVVLNYTDYEGDDWPEAAKRSLETYVAGGGGLVIYHTASCSFPKWPEYNTMIGLGGWGGRCEKDGPFVYWKDGQFVRDMTPGLGGDHGTQHAFQIVVREVEHPITKGLPEKFMHSADELYAKLRGPAKNLTVLATAYSDPKQRGSGRNEPVLMTIAYGKGRVFNTILGHEREQLRSVAFIVTFQRGTEWAATGQVTQKVPGDFPSADQPSVR